MNEPTSEGRELIRSWLATRERVDRLRDELCQAQADAGTAEKALVAWMLPPAIAVEPGEKVAIWAGDSLIQVEVGGVESGTGPVRERSSTRVTVRFRGKDFNKIR